METRPGRGPRRRGVPSLRQPYNDSIASEPRSNVLAGRRFHRRPAGEGRAMKRHGWACLVVWGALLTSGPRAPAREALPLVVEAPLAAPAEQALGDLERALRARGLDVARHPALPAGGSMPVVVGVAGTAAVDRLLAAHRIALPKEAEALCIRKLREGTRPVLLIAGRDPRGLGYALAEVARAVELTPAGDDSWAGVREAVEAPYLRTRSLTVHLFNADLEKDW